MGTPQFSVPALDALLTAGHEICAVYTQPPRKSGRGMKLTPSAVEKRARQLGIKVFTPKSLKQETEQQIFASHDCDAAIVVAYGLILPKAVLEAPHHGCFNIHASLLPRWRGAAPIHRAIMAGDTMTGVTIMQMDEGLDTGDMCITGEMPVSDQVTTGEMHDKLSRLGADLMVKALGLLEQGRIEFTRQPENGVTYAAKIDKAEAHTDFDRPAKEVLRHIHGLSPFPGAWCMLPVDGDEARVKLHNVEIVSQSGKPGTVLDDQLTIACADAAIRPSRLQKHGRPAMQLDEFLRGNQVAKGAVAG